jgi:hypothetical protein
MKEGIEYKEELTDETMIHCFVHIHRERFV